MRKQIWRSLIILPSLLSKIGGYSTVCTLTGTNHRRPSPNTILFEKSFAPSSYSSVAQIFPFSPFLLLWYAKHFPFVSRSPNGKPLMLHGEAKTWNDAHSRGCLGSVSPEQSEYQSTMVFIVRDCLPLLLQFKNTNNNH